MIKANYRLFMTSTLIFFFTIYPFLYVVSSDLVYNTQVSVLIFKDKCHSFNQVIWDIISSYNMSISVSWRHKLRKTIYKVKGRLRKCKEMSMRHPTSFKCWWRQVMPSKSMIKIKDYWLFWRSWWDSEQ